MRINLLQRHHLWIFVFLSGLCGLALGQLGATTIGLLAHPVAKTENLQPTLQRKNLPLKSLSAYQPILERNIFNSVAEAQKLTPNKTPQTITKKIPEIVSKWTLIGTISGGNTPLAILNSKGETTTYRLHAALPDGGTITTIERNKIELTYPDGHTQTLEFAQTKSNISASTRPPSKNRRITKPSVESLGENRWLIPARVAEDTRSNVGDLLKQAQAVPYLEGNRTTGFQIRMIQPGSLIEQIGLRKGDILREVNGIKLNSPEKALQVFGQLRQAKQISIGLERRGKAMTFAYEIR